MLQLPYCFAAQHRCVLLLGLQDIKASKLMAARTMTFFADM